jgi:serine/threonine protein kinase
MKIADALAAGAIVGLGQSAQVMDSPLVAAGAVGNWRGYRALYRGRPHRLLEYVPPGLVTRAGDELVLMIDTPDAAAAWDAALTRAQQLGRQLMAAGTLGGTIEPVVAFERALGTVFLVAEEGNGELLSASLTDMPWKPKAVRDLADALAKALGASHEADLLHLDIAPSTVVLTDDGAMLRGFAFDQRPLMRVLGGRTAFVRPPYSAMELYDDSARATLSPSTDIYAASALLYRVMTGLDAPDWGTRAQAGAAPTRPNVRGYVPEMLDTIERGLTLDPNQAFLSVEDWRVAMGSIVAERSWLVPALGAATLVLAAGAGYAWWDGWLAPQAPGASVEATGKSESGPATPEQENTPAPAVTPEATPTMVEPTPDTGEAPDAVGTTAPAASPSPPSTDRTPERAKPASPSASAKPAPPRERRKPTTSKPGTSGNKPPLPPRAKPAPSPSQKGVTVCEAGATINC